MYRISKKLNLFCFLSAILLFLVFSVNSTLTYDNYTTHPALTRESAKLYNLYFPNNKLSEEDIQSLIQGSIAEDTAPRWINHFYDPKDL